VIMRPPWFRTLAEAAGVILTALLLAGIAYMIRPALRPLVATLQPGPAQSDAISGAGVPFISLADARLEFSKGEALFADARSLKAYQAGHIQGAMNLDPHAFDSWSGTFFSQFPEQTRIITYCDGALCPLSTELAEKLIQMGYEKVFVLKDGWSRWRAAQLPTEQVAE
jgi:rhodanese-related sulfurtransferase